MTIIGTAVNGEISSTLPNIPTCASQQLQITVQVYDTMQAMTSYNLSQTITVESNENLASSIANCIMGGGSSPSVVYDNLNSGNVGTVSNTASMVSTAINNLTIKMIVISFVLNYGNI